MDSPSPRVRVVLQPWIPRLRGGHGFPHHPPALGSVCSRTASRRERALAARPGAEPRPPPSSPRPQRFPRRAPDIFAAGPLPSPARSFRRPQHRAHPAEPAQNRPRLAQVQAGRRGEGAERADGLLLAPEQVPASVSARGLSPCLHPRPPPVSPSLPPCLPPSLPPFLTRPPSYLPAPPFSLLPVSPSPPRPHPLPLSTASARGPIRLGRHDARRSFVSPSASLPPTPSITQTPHVTVPSASRRSRLGAAHAPPLPVWAALNPGRRGRRLVATYRTPGLVSQMVMLRFKTVSARSQPASLGGKPRSGRTAI